jgi:hypothetical protein
LTHICQSNSGFVIKRCSPHDREESEVRNQEVTSAKCDWGRRVHLASRSLEGEIQ